MEVARALSRIVDDLVAGYYGAEGTATARAYAEAAHAAAGIRANYPGDTGGSTPDALPPLPDRATTEGDPHDVSAALRRVYQELQQRYYSEKRAGDTEAAAAFGKVFMALLPICIEWGHYADQIQPPVPFVPEDKHLRIMGEAVRLAGRLGPPPAGDDQDHDGPGFDLHDLENIDLHHLQALSDAAADDDDAEYRQWREQLQVEAEELAYSCGFDTALLNVIEQHMLVEYRDHDELSPTAVAIKIVSSAALVTPPGTRGRSAALAAEINANWIVQARQHNDEAEADRLKLAITARLIGYNEAELIEALQAIPIGGFRRVDPRRSAQLAVQLVTDALDRIRALS